MITLMALACGGDDGTHPCDAGTTTCESTMVLKLPDPRTDFELHVSDELGLDLDVVCPSADTGLYVQDGVTITCGGGQVTLTQAGAFGDELHVRIEAGEDKVYAPDWQMGGDFCGNVCTTGSVQLT